MNNSLIRWTDNDKANLRKAVNNFNAKIRRLEKLGHEHLPEKVSYKELIKGKKPVYKDGELVEVGKFEILSRKELNQTLRSLRYFTKRGSEDIVKLKSGEEVTKWQRHQIRIETGRATSNIESEIDYLEWSTMFGMGNKELQQKRAQLKSIQNIENKKGYELKRGLKSLENVASASRELRKALTWKENFLYALEELDGYENVELLKEEIEKIKNPVKLQEFISRSEILKDLFLFYKEKATTQTYGGFESNQEAFDTALIELGIMR